MKFITIDKNNANSYNYDEIINKMPVFFKIYSDMCGHCVAMQKSCNNLKNNDLIKNYYGAIVEIHVDVIDQISSLSAKIDMGIPTIRAVKIQGKEWVEYNGSRSTDDMINFIKTHFDEIKPIQFQKKRKTTKKRKTMKRRKTTKRRKTMKKRKTSKKRKTMKGGSNCGSTYGMEGGSSCGMKGGITYGMKGGSSCGMRKEEAVAV